MFTFAPLKCLFVLHYRYGSQGFIIKDINPHRRFEPVCPRPTTVNPILGIQHFPDPPSELALLAAGLSQREDSGESAPNLTYLDIRGINRQDGVTLWVISRRT